MALFEGFLKRPAVPSAPPPRAATAGQSHAAPATPMDNAATSNDRAYENIEVIRDLKEIPVHNGLLTERGGSVELKRETDRQIAALLDIGNGQAIMLWTNRKRDVRAAHLIEQLARQAGIAVTKYLEVDVSLLSRIYDPTVRASANEEVKKNVALEYRSTKEDLLDRILVDAVLANASDIHIKINPGMATRVAFRINGDIRHMQSFSYELGDELAKSLHVMGDQGQKSGVQFEKRSFQDVRITRDVTVGSKAMRINLRFSSSPAAPDGNKIVLRVIQQGASGEFWSLEKLGYTMAHILAFQRMLAQPDGLIAMVGTTGSGKSRTLQTLLGMLNVKHEGRKNICTLEDPIEYPVLGATQILVPRRKNKEGQDVPDFAAALRNQMRQDPDIIMVGEVRDEDTAHLVQDAVETGHKVLTTVHARSCVGALDRLIKKGYERAALASEGTISGIIYQKLVPVLCEDCKVDVFRARTDLPEGFFEHLQRYVTEARIDMEALRFRGKGGCVKCGYTGIIGRTVAPEMLVSPDLEFLDYVASDDRNAAAMYWRKGGAPGFDDGVTGRTYLEAGQAKMAEGSVSPLDIQSELGELGSDVSIGQAVSWLKKHTDSEIVRAVEQR